MNNHEQYPGRQWWERLEMWEDWLKGHIWYNVDGAEVEGIITREPGLGQWTGETASGAVGSR